MTNRVNALTVVLEHDAREEDVAALIAAIRLFQNVLTVEINVSHVADLIAEKRARRALEDRLWEVLHPPAKEKWRD